MRCCTHACRGILPGCLWAWHAQACAESQTDFVGQLLSRSAQSDGREGCDGEANDIPYLYHSMESWKRNWQVICARSAMVEEDAPNMLFEVCGAVMVTGQ
jgi:hypothetical protein